MLGRRRRGGFSEDAAAFERGESGEVRKVQASVAKAHFSQLLDEIERGTTIVILRHGRPIARLVPEAQRRRQEIAEALENIEALGKEIREKHGAMTREETLSLRHEGRKY